MVNFPGHQLIENVEVEIGGQRIENNMVTDTYGAN